MGSKSTINYGAKSTITFGNVRVEEYFDITNIDYYNVILGTPSLQRLNIMLDFTVQALFAWEPLWYPGTSLLRPVRVSPK